MANQLHVIGERRQGNLERVICGVPAMVVTVLSAHFCMCFIGINSLCDVEASDGLRGNFDYQLTSYVSK